MKYTVYVYIFFFSRKRFIITPLHDYIVLCEFLSQIQRSLIIQEICNMSNCSQNQLICLNLILKEKFKLLGNLGDKFKILFKILYFFMQNKNSHSEYACTLQLQISDQIQSQGRLNTLSISACIDAQFQLQVIMESKIEKL